MLSILNDLATAPTMSVGIATTISVGIACTTSVGIPPPAFVMRMVRREGNCYRNVADADAPYARLPGGALLPLLLVVELG
jgi:hypothetical protein